MDDRWLDALEQQLALSKERRKTLFGSRKTTRAEVAEIMLLGSIPGLLRQVRKLRAELEKVKESK